MPDQSQPFRALISASNLYRRKLCPGSAKAEEGLPEFSPSAAQRQGTDLHAKEYDEESSRDELKAGEKRALEKNKRMTEDFIRQTFLSLEIADPGPCRVFKEREFFLSDESGDPVYPAVPGHTDEVHWYPQHKIVFVFDSKFGRKPVQKAEMNYQLRLYFVMVQDEIGGERIFCAIRQPYLKSPEDFHSVEYITSEHAEASRREILQIIAECSKPDAKRIPSIDACTYCRAQGTARCPESRQFLRQVSRQHILALHPPTLEAMATDIIAAENVIEAWYDRMQFIAETYPELLQHYGLGFTQYTDSVRNIAAAYGKLAPFFDSERNTSSYDGFLRFVTNCCKLSVPKMRNYLIKHHSMTEDDAYALIVRELGVQHEGEDPIEGALIFSKPKKRMLVKTTKERS